MIVSTEMRNEGSPLKPLNLNWPLKANEYGCDEIKARRSRPLLAIT